MKTEFKTLSEKRDNFLDMNIDKYIYYEKDIKEFIKKIKEKTKVGTKWYRLGFHRFIEELAGDDLIK